MKMFKENKSWHCILGGKKKFYRKEAKAHQKISSIRYGLKLFIYKCPECRYYHLTRNKQ